MIETWMRVTVKCCYGGHVFIVITLLSRSIFVVKRSDVVDHCGCHLSSN